MAFTHLEVAGLQEGDCPLRASEQEAADDGRRSLYPPMFVLLRGAAHVSIDLLDGESEPLAVLSQPGECFGELVAAWPGLTHGRSATVTAAGAEEPEEAAAAAAGGRS